MDEIDVDEGIYILAYMKQVVYIGKSESGVNERLVKHVDRRTNVGSWMASIASDWSNVRLDVLEAPLYADSRAWLKETEARLIAWFRPLFNDLLMSGNGYK